MKNTGAIVTGAANGIGKEIALQLAKKFNFLGLIDMDPRALEEVSRECARSDCIVECVVIDVRDRKSLKKWVVAFDKRNEVELFVANAGISPVTSKYGPKENALSAKEVVDVNLVGTINSVHSILPQMMKRNRGQIALMASLAAYGPIGASPSYCASKAGVLSYGQCLRYQLSSFGIRVSSICPGYISTRLTSFNGFEEGKISKRIDPCAGAKIIVRGLEKNHAVINFPLRLFFSAKLIYSLPEWLLKLVTEKYQNRS